MKCTYWNQFVDHFIDSLNRLVPFQSFFAYCSDLACDEQFKSYYSRNLSQQSIHHYIHCMSQYDPLLTTNQPHFRQNIQLLNSQEIPEQYQFFLKEYRVLDNIELVFKFNSQQALGISLIRHSNESIFTAHEIEIIKTCYHLTQLNSQEYLNTRNGIPQVPEEITQHLTRSECIVLNLILTGKKNQEIADELFVSIATVKTHLHHIFQKTMVKSKRELIIKTLSAQS